MHTTTIFHGDCLQVEGVLLIVLRAYSRLLPLLAHDQCMRTASSVYRPTHLFEYAVSELAFKKKKKQKPHMEHFSKTRVLQSHNKSSSLMRHQTHDVYTSVCLVWYWWYHACASLLRTKEASGPAGLGSKIWCDELYVSFCLLTAWNGIRAGTSHGFLYNNKIVDNVDRSLRRNCSYLKKG